MKQNFINKQKKVIQNIRDNYGCESSREEAIEKLNLMVDDYEKDNNTIDNDNIHLYYEFMSDKELLKFSLILITSSTEIKSRFKKIVELLNIKKDSRGAYDYCNIYGFINGEPIFKKLDVDYGVFILKYDIFGVVDTLKPIDDYVEEIKNSSEYKEYIENKSKERIA